MDPSSDADRLWRAAQALNRAAAAVSPEAGRLPPLLFFTDPDRTPRPWETAARLPAGAGVVWRAFGRDSARDDGLRLRDATRRSGAVLLVGLDAELAERVEADGLHLPERALMLAQGLRAAHPEWLLTGALHGPPDDAAALTALDAVTISPVFPAGGASSVRPPLGPAGFAAIRKAVSRPAYALGGVSLRHTESLKDSGACGMAAIEAIQTAWS